MKQCWIQYIEEKNRKKIPLFFKLMATLHGQQSLYTGVGWSLRRVCFAQGMKLDTFANKLINLLHDFFGAHNVWFGILFIVKLFIFYYYLLYMYRMSWCGAMTEWCAGPWVLDSRWSNSSSSVSDTDSFWSAGSGSGSRREGQNEPQKWRKFKFWSARCSLLRDEDFSCSLDVVLYGGLEMSKLQFLIKKFKFFSAVNFSKFWSSKPWIWIRIRIRIRIDKKCWIRIRIRIRIDTNADPQHWYLPSNLCWSGTNPLVSLLPGLYGSASVVYGSATSFFLFFNTDPDSTFYFNADPDSTFLLLCGSGRIQILLLYIIIKIIRICDRWSTDPPGIYLSGCASLFASFAPTASFGTSKAHKIFTQMRIRIQLPK